MSKTIDRLPRLNTLNGDATAAKLFNYDPAKGELSYSDDYPDKRRRNKVVTGKNAIYGGNYVAAERVVDAIIRHNNRMVRAAKAHDPLIQRRGTREEQAARMEQRRLEAEKVRRRREELREKKNQNIERLLELKQGSKKYSANLKSLIATGDYMLIGAIVYFVQSRSEVYAFVDGYGFFGSHDSVSWHPIKKKMKYLRDLPAGSVERKGESMIAIPIGSEKSHEHERMGKYRATMCGMTYDEVIAARRFIEEQRKKAE